jgi:hypothetical protein
VIFRTIRECFSHVDSTCLRCKNSIHVFRRVAADERSKKLGIYGFQTPDRRRTAPEPGGRGGTEVELIGSDAQAAPAEDVALNFRLT